MDENKNNSNNAPGSEKDFSATVIIRMSAQEREYLETLARESHTTLSHVARTQLFKNVALKAAPYMTDNEAQRNNVLAVRSLRDSFKKLVGQHKSIIDEYKSSPDYSGKDSRCLAGLTNIIVDLQKSVNRCMDVLEQPQIHIIAYDRSTAPRESAPAPQARPDPQAPAPVKEQPKYRNNSIYYNMETCCIAGVIIKDAKKFVTKSMFEMMSFQLCCIKEDGSKKTYYEVAYRYDENLLPKLVTGRNVTVSGDFEIFKNEVNEKVYINIKVKADHIILGEITQG